MKRRVYCASVGYETRKLLYLVKVLTAISAGCTLVWLAAHRWERRCKE